MPEEEVTEVSESSTEQDVETSESSTEESEETEQTSDSEATEEKAAEKEPPFNEHPAWKDFQQRKEAETRKAEQAAAEARAQAEYYRGLAERSKEDPNAVKEQNSYFDEKIKTAPDADTREFWQGLKTSLQSEIDRVRKEERKSYESQLASVQSMVGRTIANEFLKSHPDVEKGSPEMEAIVKKANKESSMGKDINEALDDAYKSVMFNKAQEAAVERERLKYKQKVQKKKDANLETETISKKSPLNKQGDDIESIFNQVEKDLGVTY